MKKTIRLETSPDYIKKLDPKEFRVINVIGVRIAGIETFPKFNLDDVKIRYMNLEEIEKFYAKQLKDLNPNKVIKNLTDKHRETVILCSKIQKKTLTQFLGLENPTLDL